MLIPKSASSLTVSIVTYRPDRAALRDTLRYLDQAIDYAKRRGVLDAVSLFLIDNTPGAQGQTVINNALTESCSSAEHVDIVCGHGNIGYGAGHNLAITRTDTQFHLILNPDVWLENASLYEALKFMAAYPEVGLLAPMVVDQQGARQFLCKRYPSVLDLLLRGFAPGLLRRLFRRRLDYYEMRDQIGDVVIWNVPLISGCFMLFRHPLLVGIQGFDAKFFLYFEDYDISLRTAKHARIAYVPAVRIVHFGGQAARKGWRHIGLFLRSAVTFFNRYGWKWF
ncbi:MAG: glycosyltransferase family 2 protein [Candidatus Competibacteraceae bacterium]|nr:glycosyltransferase family 2 protein [Candidatus Competibacteraceae bacterium]